MRRSHIHTDKLKSLTIYPFVTEGEPLTRVSEMQYVRVSQSVDNERGDVWTRPVIDMSIHGQIPVRDLSALYEAIVAVERLGNTWLGDENEEAGA